MVCTIVCAWGFASTGSSIKFFTHGKLVGVVHCQRRHGRPADIGLARQANAFSTEMLVPTVAPWMKQSREQARKRIDAGDIRSLVAIAVAACERKITFARLAAVLGGNDVIDLKAKPPRGLRHSTIFADVRRPLADEAIEICVHDSSS